MSSYDLTQGDIRAHIWRLAVPAAIGLFCQTLFNLTDTFYAGYISTTAQSALAFAFPLAFISLSFCVGIGQAVTARVANALGSKHYARATCFVGQGVVLVALVSLLFWFVLYPLSGNILTHLGATGEGHRLATQFSQILYLGAPLFLTAFLLNSALQAVGNTWAFRNAIVFSVVLNIFLDPILMFGWFGVPPLGLGGAAVATLLSQLFAIVYLLPVLAKTILAKRWRWGFAMPSLPLLRALTKQALAPTGRMLCIGTSFFIIIGYLGRFDEAAVAAYGIALRVEQLFLLPMIGLEVAILAFAGQNLGAGMQQKVVIAYRHCLKIGGLIVVISAAMVLIGGRWMIGLFNDDAAVLDYGQEYLLAAAVTGPFYLLCNAAGAVLLGALRILDIALLSVVRLVILPFSLFFLLAFVGGLGVQGIWLGIFLSTVAPAIWLHRRCLWLLTKTP